MASSCVECAKVCGDYSGALAVIGQALWVWLEGSDWSGCVERGHRWSCNPEILVILTNSSPSCGD